MQVNGNTIAYWENIGKFINESKGEISHLLLNVLNSLVTLQLTPKVIDDQNVFGEKITRRIIGISPSGKQTTVHFGLVDGISYAWDETKKASWLIVESVQKLITGVVGADKLGGIITIVDVTSQASCCWYFGTLFLYCTHLCKLRST